MDTDASAGGTLEAIWVKRASRGPMDSTIEAELVAGRGIVGNANQGGHRQVTLIERDKWDRIADELEGPVEPAMRRANLMVSGVRLNDSRGRILTIGGCRLRILGETRPCRLMDETCPGLQAALDPDWRAGAYGEVLDDGVVTLGDAVRWANS